MTSLFSYRATNKRVALLGTATILSLACRDNGFTRISSDDDAKLVMGHDRERDTSGVGRQMYWGIHWEMLTYDELSCTPWRLQDDLSQAKDNSTDRSIPRRASALWLLLFGWRQIRYAQEEGAPSGILRPTPRENRKLRTILSLRFSLKSAGAGS